MERMDLRFQMLDFIDREFAYIPELIPTLKEKFGDELVNYRIGNLGNPSSIRYLRGKLVWDFLKPGDEIIVNSPTWEHNGKRLTLKKKQNYALYCYKADEPNTVYKISSSHADLTPPVQKQKMNVKVGDLVTVVSDYYRPRYDRDTLFVVVWKGPKYVRLAPRFPKFVVWENPNKTARRIGDNIFERPEPGSTSYFGQGVYNTDIPIIELAPPDQYSGEDLQTVKDLGDLGF